MLNEIGDIACPIIAGIGMVLFGVWIAQGQWYEQWYILAVALFLIFAAIAYILILDMITDDAGEIIPDPVPCERCGTMVSFTQRTANGDGTLEPGWSDPAPARLDRHGAGYLREGETSSPERGADGE